MDFSIPPNLPVNVQENLDELIQDYKDANLTAKGYNTKRKQILDSVEASERSLSPGNNSVSSSSNLKSLSMKSSLSRRREPGHMRNMSLPTPLINRAPSSVLSDSSSITFPRTRGSVYRVTTTNSNRSGSSSGAPRIRKRRSTRTSLSSYDLMTSGGSYNPMVPLLPRNKVIKDNGKAHNRGSIESSSSALAGFTTSIPSILRARAENSGNETAIIGITSKGKDSYITWEKLYLRAERVAHELARRHLYKMDKIPLWYKKEESIEFAAAILGCFISGMTAVPISFETYTLGEIMEIIKMTGSKLILISNDCYKQLNNLQSISNNTRIKLIKIEFFQNITFLRTDSLGTYSKAKKTPPTFDPSTLSYIEFTRTPLGRLSGVVVRHNTLINQLNILARILDSKTMPTWKKVGIMKPFTKKAKLTSTNGRQLARFVILSSLDPTRSTGLLFGLLFNIYTGNLLITIDDGIVNRPGGYENIIDLHRADILLNDQLQLKQVVINYLENPDLIGDRRKHKVNFDCIKCCLTSCNFIDTDVTEMVVHKWLKNFGCTDAPLVYSPMLTLQDFGGILVSTSDQLGGSKDFFVHNKKLRLQDELFINREKLKSNIIEESINAMLNSSSSFKDYLRTQAFGFPIPDTTVCVVNPDDCTLVPDLTVGEIWISSPTMIDEFFQMDRINNFVFKAKLNYQKMFSYANEDRGLLPYQRASLAEKLENIYKMCPIDTNFLRTKLMGFVFNGKLYILSLIEDMFLQNRLIRLPNWAHTSDLSRSKKAMAIESKPGPANSRPLSDSDLSPTTLDSHGDFSKPTSTRVVETHYLQHITETVVRTVFSVSEVSAFELNHHKEEHFLVMIVESSLAKMKEIDDIGPEGTPSQLTDRPGETYESFEKKMNDLTDQIYRILWIFHKIQPFCILVVPRGSLPKRYCSLEIANSIVEKKFTNGELNTKFIKFQFDNVILDFIPHSAFYNESIFSEHLSNLRRSYLEALKGYQLPSIGQDSGIDYRETAYDIRQKDKKLTDFISILEVLEWRIATLPNESAYSCQGEQLHIGYKDGELRSVFSWRRFEIMVTSFLRKIVGSKVPLKANDHVVVMAENSIEYVAIVHACFYCNLVVIPLPPIQESSIDSELEFLTRLIKSYKVKRIFIDGATHTLITNNKAINSLFKRYRRLLPKITILSKIKMKSDMNLVTLKRILQQKYNLKPGRKVNSHQCVIWIDRSYDSRSKIHVTMTHAALMNVCKIVKESLHIGIDSPTFSLCTHTSGLGFVLSCLLGIYVGSTTYLFDLPNVLAEPEEFLSCVQNLYVKDLYLELPTFQSLISKASKVLNGMGILPNNPASSSKSKNLTTSGTNAGVRTSLRPDIFRTVQNLMIPFTSRPDIARLDEILNRYKEVEIRPEQISLVYRNHFNPIISSQSYLDTARYDIYLDPVALREGIVREVNPADTSGALRLRDSGVVLACTDVSIVNPETLLPCLDGEIGEIWCCSEANAFNYMICHKDGTLTRDNFITEQFRSRLGESADNGLTYLRTGDLGFIKSVERTNSRGDLLRVNLLYVLGHLYETIEFLGLTHFVSDLEQTVKTVHSAIKNCIIAKAGGLIVCLLKCRRGYSNKYGNLAALVVSELLNKHGILLDLCSFVKVGPGAPPVPDHWECKRSTIMQDWFNQEIIIDSQFAVNSGENISIYLLSDFEKEKNPQYQFYHRKRNSVS